MAEEKNQATATMDAAGENTVEVTFLPEGKTVTFEHGKLPYKDHGKEESRLIMVFAWIMPVAAIAPAPPVTCG